MSHRHASSERTERLLALYQAFNERDLDAAMSAMAVDVDWPNGWEGGRLVGRDSVRAYWERQWAAQVRPTARVTATRERPDGTVEVRVRQVVRHATGAVLDRADVVHVYEFAGSLVQRMRVER